MKGEQLQNFIAHCFHPDPPTSTDGAICSPPTPNVSPRDPNSIGSVMDSETLVYFQWAQRAWSRQGRTAVLPSSATESADFESDDFFEPPLPLRDDDPEDDPEPPARDTARERKQRKLWAYRQRTMAWCNPLKWTRPAFRHRLNEQFVESLMAWPPNWTSARIDCGPEVTALWRSRALSHLSNFAGGLDWHERSTESI